MKKRTTKILLGVLAAITLFVMIAVALPYFFKDHLTLTPVQLNAESDWQELQLNNFDKITVFGSWAVRIKQGNEYSVSVKAPAGLTDKSCTVQNGELIINKLADNLNSAPRIEITMPKLQNVHILGAAEVRVSDFKAPKQPFVLTVEGATSFRADRSTFENVKIACQGASSIEFRGCVINSADVNIAGASSVELDRMNGGELTGELNGVASLRYSGNIASNKIKTSGLAVVKQN
ncbi:MAG: DUF2807 domain-containing protein [Negativicutes bacterium]|jgi:hypothetical protein